MKKILAFILAAFFVVLSPISVYAATTESMMYFSNMRTVANPYDVTFSVGEYVYSADDYSFSSYSYSDVNGVIAGNRLVRYVGVNNFGNYMLVSVGLSTGSTFGGNGTTVSILSDVFQMFIQCDYGLTTQQRFSLNANNLNVYKCWADLHWEATQQIGNTHSSTYADHTIPINNFLRSSDSATYDIWIDTSIVCNAPEPGEGIDRVYGHRLTDITLYALIPLDSQFEYYINNVLTQYSRDLYSSDSPIRYNLWLNTDSDFFVQYNSTESNSDNTIITGISSLQSSISQMGSSMNKSINTLSNNVSTQFTQVKTQLTTMSNDIKSGLNNVVESAKTNTQNIINTVTQKVDQLKETVTEVKDSILDLPNKIQEMLLGLIVPDSETMASKYTEFSGLLEEKLGVIYQIPSMLFDFFDTIVNATTTPQSSLTLPAFQLPWIDGSTLTIWQPIEYKIIPDGLEVLSDLIQTVTSMTVVVLTFNSVKRAYERFLRG